jgi:hypothetical protein
MADEEELAEAELEGAVEKLVPEVVRRVYAEEQEALLERDARANDNITRNTPGWIQFLEFMSPWDVLDPSPSSMASQPADPKIASQRAKDAVKRIEAGLPFPLDEVTKCNIFHDICSMWGRPLLVCPPPEPDIA